MDQGLAEDHMTMLRAAVRGEVEHLFKDLRGFVDRRVAELSMEVSAAVQLMDFGEANLTQQLNRVHDQVASLLAAPATATRNSGLELEAVVQTTEAAATQIMEAAEAIAEWLRSGSRDPAALELIEDRVNAIFEACSFQDLTGQRVRRAITHLQSVKSLLGGLVAAPAANSPGEGAAANVSPPAAVADPDLAQSEIDRLMAEF